LNLSFRFELYSWNKMNHCDLNRISLLIFNSISIWISISKSILMSMFTFNNFFLSMSMLISIWMSMFTFTNCLCISRCSHCWSVHFYLFVNLFFDFFVALVWCSEFSL
jgi:hypothetical protein